MIETANNIHHPGNSLFFKEAFVPNSNNRSPIATKTPIIIKSKVTGLFMYILGVLTIVIRGRPCLGYLFPAATKLAFLNRTTVLAGPFNYLVSTCSYSLIVSSGAKPCF